MRKAVKNIFGKALAAAPKGVQTQFKEMNEMLFWRKHKLKQGNELYNGHMNHFFTEHFGIEPSYYSGKRILDVGCGPVGTLEWATDAAERVGLDPLADKYVKLTGGKHAMRYVKSGSEDIPFEDGHFDIVTTFNSLDHVEDVDQTISELCRVLRPGGDLLLIVEINHEPTITEPHFLTEALLEQFKGCQVVTTGQCAIRDDHDVYASLSDKTPMPSPNDEGLLWAHFKKQTTA
ncbi:MAG: class I SAM-dependent methyltransferase [Pseudomonadota bacterium]